MPRVYRMLLRLYPADYRAMFAAEMFSAFERAAEDRRLSGRPGLVHFVLAELVSLAIRAGTEWIAKLTTGNAVRGRTLPDLRMMRPPGVPRELWFAGACMGGGQPSLPDEVMEAQRRITALINRTVYAIANHDFPGARTYCREEREARENLRRLREQYDIDCIENDQPS